MTEADRRTTQANGSIAYRLILIIQKTLNYPWDSTLMKYSKMAAYILFMFSLIASPAIVRAQDIFYDVRNATGTAEFLLGSRLVENASYASSAVTLSSILSDNSRAYFDLSYTRIFPQAEYSSSQGELGLQLRYLEFGDSQLYAGLYGYLNQYHKDYSYYNSSGFGLYGKWKYYFKTSQLMTLGYELESKKFAEITEASNTEHNLYLIYNQSFKTKTAVNFHTEFSIQDFWPQVSYVSRGRMITATVVNDIPDNMLFSTELRVSQSLGPKIGLTIWLANQSLLNDVADSLSLQDGLDNPFIDNFRWEGISSSIRLMYRINSNNGLKLSHSYVEKSFLDVPVYLFDFQTMNYSLINDDLVSLGFDRTDTRNDFLLQWTRNWTYDYASYLSGLELVLGLGYTRNQSNDALYDYDGMSYSVGINFNN